MSSPTHRAQLLFWTFRLWHIVGVRAGALTSRTELIWMKAFARPSVTAGVLLGAND
jgi:hypothetical protein